MALVVITGGVRSGKSVAAQRLAELHAREGVDVSVAVFGRATDEEMAARIESHRLGRPGAFDTIEVSRIAGWADPVPAESLLVLDCLGTALGLIMEEAWASSGSGEMRDAEAEGLPEGFGQHVEEAFSALVEEVCARPGDTIVVTNEAGSGVVPAWASGRLFSDLLGRANRTIVTAADAAYLCVCGRMLDLSALPSAIDWPED